MTIKEYASSRNITYEAARKSLRKYENELASHLAKRGKSTILDDDAVAFLDTKRVVSASAVHDMARQMSKSDEVKELSDENRALKDEVKNLKDMLKEKTEVAMNSASDIEIIAENQVLRSQIEELKSRLKDETDKNVELEAEKIEMMDNDWQYFGDGSILKDGGYLIRHHYNAFERVENPPVALIYDVFYAEKRENSDGLLAALVNVNVRDIDRHSMYSKEKLLRQIGKSGEEKKPVLKIMPGILWAKEIVNLYGPIQCKGMTRNKKRVTENNILISKEEAMEWLIDIGADSFV